MDFNEMILAQYPKKPLLIVSLACDVGKSYIFFAIILQEQKCCNFASQTRLRKLRLQPSGSSAIKGWNLLK